MISKQDILKAVKLIHKSGSNPTQRKLIHPAREWSLGLFLFVICVTVGAVYNYQLYTHYKSIDALTTSDPEQAPSYREEIVNDVVATYQDRKEQYDSLSVLTTVSTSTESSAMASSSETAVAVDLATTTTSAASTTEASAI